MCIYIANLGSQGTPQELRELPGDNCHAGISGNPSKIRDSHLIEVRLINFNVLQ